MKFNYKFSNLLGTVYHKGNLVFTPDGNSVISPVGNRITVYDLKNNKASTLPIESRFNYTSIDLSPNGCILLAANEDGEVHLISMASCRIVHKHHFIDPIACIRFSPDGKHFAICKANNVFVFRAPGAFSGLVNPFVMERVFHGSYDDTTCLDWSSDSRIIAVGSKDMSTKLYSLEKLANFQSYSLGSHTDSIVGCFFEKNSLNINTVSANGQVCIWECSITLDELVLWEPQLKKKCVKIDSEDDVPSPVENNAATSENTCDNEVQKLFYTRLARHYLCDELKGQYGVKLTSSTYHKETRILVTGYSSGAFLLHELPDVNLIHSLSIETSISSVAVNGSGDWLAVGSPELGRLLVWEWQSETYVMKQQGHFNNTHCLSFSPDGQYIVTGGDDGKVKVWNMATGFCFITFSEHTAGITGVQYSPNKKFVVSASLDGTVRAFDMTRYRNFKTFTSPRPVQFSCVALDGTAEFVAAGGQDVFEIYLWSLKIGRLVEILNGHEGPVSSIAFSQNITCSILCSVSWDKTLKIWDAIESGGTHTTIHLTADGLCVSFSPSGQEVAVTTSDGQITFFNVKNQDQIGNIEGRNDLGSGRSDTDLITAKKNLQAKAFISLCYSADGKCIIAGGQSKNVCIYNVSEGILIKKFEITQNRSFDAVDDFINRRKMTEYGNINLIEQREQLEGGNVALKLPGVKKGDMASRAFKPEVRVSCLQFSPTGISWAASTTEGLLVYSLDSGLVFDPFQLEVDVTPTTTRQKLDQGENSEALMMALKLNESNLIKEVLEKILPDQVEITIQSLPQVYVEKTLKAVTAALESSRHIEFYLLWIQALLTIHGPKLNSSVSKSNMQPVLVTLQKNLRQKYEELCKICDFNKYTMKVVERLRHHNNLKQMDENEDFTMQ